MPAWTVNDSAQRDRYERGQGRTDTPGPAMVKYHQWKNAIKNRNLHPKTAAEEVGDMHYEQLSGKLKGQYTVRISVEHRVAFTFDTDTKVVSVFLIGGHYPPS
jgi:Txe/YoeB family toxin of Txe-Axe toxin-antitoxin module